MPPTHFGQERVITPRRARQDKIDRSEAADSTPPKLANDPTENAESADPTEPMDSTEPTEPIDSMDLFEAMLRNESLDRMDKRDRFAAVTASPSIPVPVNFSLRVRIAGTCRREGHERSFSDGRRRCAPAVQCFVRDCATRRRHNRGMSLEAAASDDVELTQARAQIHNLQVALVTCRRIGIAIGIVMATQRVSPEEAFDALRRLSQAQHRKIRDLAEDVIYTGELTAHTRRDSAEARASRPRNGGAQ